MQICINDINPHDAYALTNEIWTIAGYSCVIDVCRNGICPGTEVGRRKD